MKHGILTITFTDCGCYYSSHKSTQITVCEFIIIWWENDLRFFTLDKSFICCDIYVSNIKKLMDIAYE